MQSLSSTQRAWINRGGLINPSINAELIDGITTIQISADDILEGSLWIDRRSATGRKFEIGTAGTCELTFTLLNHSGDYTGIKFEGAILTLTLDIHGESLAGGIYIVDEKPQAGQTMKIRALDRMAKTNKLYDSTLEYPATLQEILTDACTRCGLSLCSSVFPNHTYSVIVQPDADSTYHQVIGWVAQLAGCEAFINVNGLLELKNYSGTAETIVNVMDVEYAEDDVSVTGVEYQTDEGIYLAGVDTYTIDVTGNPFVMTDIAAVLGMINTQINGLTFRPIKRLRSVSLPHLWPMDRILFDDGGTTYQSIITGIRIGHRSEIVAIGEPEIVAGYAGSSGLSAKQKNIIKTISKDIADIKVSAVEIELLALNEQITNGLGFYTTVITEEDGKQTVYHHDLPTLEESQYIDVKTSVGGFAWTTTGWNDGNPIWEYGVTQSGSLIMRIISAVGINADWVKTGKVMHPTGKTYFDLDNDEIKMESTIGGQNTVILINPTVGFQITVDGRVVFSTSRYPIRTQGYEASGRCILGTSSSSISFDIQLVDIPDVVILTPINTTTTIVTAETSGITQTGFTARASAGCSAFYHAICNIKYYLYRLGVELMTFVAGYALGTGNLDKVTYDYLLLSATEDEEFNSVRTYVTDSAIDLTYYNKLFIDWENSGSGDDLNKSFTVVADISGKSTDMSDYEVRLAKQKSFSRIIEEVNVSTLIGNFYIKLHAQAQGPGISSTLKVHRAWLI